jgi:uncharacterized protein (TIGR00255 family)
MIRSMTGFGRSRVAVGNGEVTVEVRTVNHRYLDCSSRLPRAIGGYEIEVERIVRRKINRGHVYVTVSFDRSLEAAGVGINRELLAHLYRQLTDAAAREGIPGRVDVNTLLSLPDLLTFESDAMPSSRLWPAVRSALNEALARCSGMREVEGAELARDIGNRLGSLERIAARIEKRAPAALRRSLARAKKRLEQLLGETAVGDDRWAVEAAILAERSDFAEELVRLKSHLGQFRSLIEKGGEVSKKLTFLLQEIHREATTMGNKASDAAIIGDCLAAKSVVEKMREQVQNLE